MTTVFPLSAFLYFIFGKLSKAFNSASLKLLTCFFLLIQFYHANAAQEFKYYRVIL